MSDAIFMDGDVSDDSIDALINASPLMDDIPETLATTLATSGAVPWERVDSSVSAGTLAADELYLDRFVNDLASACSRTFPSEPAARAPPRAAGSRAPAGRPPSKKRPRSKRGEKRRAPAMTVYSQRFFGVSVDPVDGRWRARYHADGVDVDLGAYDDEEAAARAYNAGVTAAGLRRRMNQVRPDGTLKEKPPTSSQYLGVRWFKRDKKWLAQVHNSTRCGLNGKMKTLGRYDDEADAALAVDAYLRSAMPSVAARKANFPTAAELAAAAAPPPKPPKRRKPAPTVIHVPTVIRGVTTITFRTPAEPAGVTVSFPSSASASSASASEDGGAYPPTAAAAPGLFVVADESPRTAADGRTTLAFASPTSPGGTTVSFRPPIPDVAFFKLPAGAAAGASALPSPSVVRASSSAPLARVASFG